MQGHTVIAFDVELERLHQAIATMGALAEAQFTHAIQAVVERDGALAAAVLGGDAEIDRLEREVEAITIRLIALRQPMAKDLRDVVAALKISANLERIGDFATNIAKRALTLAEIGSVEPVPSLGRIGDCARGMVHDVVVAYLEQNAGLALEVRNRDEELDAAYTSLFRELLTSMMESPQRITGCTHLIFSAKAIERVGDHATNIAENVCYLVSGRLPADARPKDDRSSFTVVPMPPTGRDGAPPG